MNNKFDFTPGPWEYDNDRDKRIFVYKKETSKCICATMNYTNGEEIANAQLIASAPEMIEALIELVNSACYECPKEINENNEEISDCINCNISKYIKLIEKATGKSWSDIK